MPPQPYLTDWIVLRVHILHLGNNMLLTYNYKRTSGTPSESSMQALCQQFWAQNGARLAGLMATTYSFILVDATDRSAEGGAYGSYIPLTNTVGTKTGDAIPANVAHCISLKTGKSGRSFHGRQYMCGWVDADYTNDNLTSPNQIALANYIQGVIGYAFPGPLQATYCVMSLKNLELTPINGFAMDSVADSQRRRLTGRGY